MGNCQKKKENEWKGDRTQRVYRVKNARIVREGRKGRREGSSVEKTRGAGGSPGREFAYYRRPPGNGGACQFLLAKGKKTDKNG